MFVPLSLFPLSLVPLPQGKPQVSQNGTCDCRSAYTTLTLQAVLASLALRNQLNANVHALFGQWPVTVTIMPYNLSLSKITRVPTASNPSAGLLILTCLISMWIIIHMLSVGSHDEAMQLVRNDTGYFIG